MKKIQTAKAKQLLLARLRFQRLKQGVKGKRDWTRDELYDLPIQSNGMKS